jgi:hypothetical protein
METSCDAFWGVIDKSRETLAVSTVEEQVSQAIGAQLNRAQIQTEFLAIAGALGQIPLYQLSGTASGRIQVWKQPAVYVT